MIPFLDVVRPKHLTLDYISEEERIWNAFQEGSSPFFSSLFRSESPLFIEYCSGNGGWIAQKAIEAKNATWLAVEVKWSRIRKIWAKIKNHGLTNLVGVFGEGYSWTKSHVPDGSIDGIFVNFPDPWPKRHHMKYRLLNTPFIQELGRILKSGGSAVIVTDHLPYSEEVLDIFSKDSQFTPRYPYPHYLNDYESYGTSFFEDLWRRKGLEIRYLIFDRR